MATFQESFGSSKKPKSVAGKVGKTANNILNSGPVQKMFDILQAPQRAIFGSVTGIGPVEGNKQRTTGEDVLKHFKAPEGPKIIGGINARTAAGFGLDLFADPLNLVGVGLVSKVDDVSKVQKAINITKGVQKVEEAKDFAVTLKGIPKIKPITVYKSEKIGKAIQGTAKTIKNIPAVKAVRDVAGKAFVPMYGIDETTANKFIETQRGTESARKMAIEVGQELENTSDEVAKSVMEMFERSGKKIDMDTAKKYAKVRMAQVLRYGSVSTIPGLDETVGKATKLALNGKEQYFKLDKIKGQFKSLAQDLVEVGVFDEDVLTKENYLPRLYQVFQDDGALNKLGLNLDIGSQIKKIKPGYDINKTLQSGRTVQRMDDAELGRRAFFRDGKTLQEISEVPLNELKARGENVRLKELKESFDPVSASVLGIYQEGRLLANAKLLNYLGDNAENLIKIASENGNIGELTEPLVGKEWGALEGKIVPKAIKDELKSFVGNKSSSIEKIIDKVTRHWAYGATIPNPGYHLRNFMSNLYLSYLGGLNPAEYLTGIAMRKYGKANKYFQEAVDTGVIGTNALAREIEGLTDGLENQKSIVQMFKDGDVLDLMDVRIAGRGKYNPLGKYFKAMEKLGPVVEDNARLALYSNLREKGYDALQAGKHVNKYLFDYKALTPFEKRFMKRLFPFYTFPRKVLPLILETAVKDTGKISFVPKTAQFIENASRDSNAARMEKYLPKWMREGFYIRTPFTQKNPDTGREEYLYLDTRILPFQDLFEISTPRGIASRTNPLIKAPVEVATNKNIFFDKEITSKYNPWQVKVWDHLQNAMQSSSPYNRLFSSAMKLQASIRGTEDYASRNKELWVVLLDTLGGLKLQPFNVQEGIKSSKQEKSQRKSSLKREATKSKKTPGPINNLRRNLIENELNR